MTQAQKDLVLSSFARLAGMAEQASAAFYGDLFRRAPSLRVLFTEDLAGQRETLMKMLGLAVATLNDGEALAGVIKQEGRRHVAYGVKPKDYDTVGAALLSMLQITLGREFTPDLRQAWIDCYLALAAGMLSGLEPEAA